jgi:hypothetical protein
MSRWRREASGLELRSLRRDDGTAYLLADPAVADEIVATLDRAPREAEQLRDRLERLEAEIEEAREQARAARREPAPARAGKRPAPTDGELESVPLALVAPFRADRALTAKAERDPLLALAVQASNALQPDASELDRARLAAMAFAASRGDMDAFWGARKQRSAKKLARR